MIYYLEEILFAILMVSIALGLVYGAKTQQETYIEALNRAWFKRWHFYLVAIYLAYNSKRTSLVDGVFNDAVDMVTGAASAMILYGVFFLLQKKIGPKNTVAVRAGEAVPSKRSNTQTLVVVLITLFIVVFLLGLVLNFIIRPSSGNRELSTRYGSHADISDARSLTRAERPAQTRTDFSQLTSGDMQTLVDLKKKGISLLPTEEQATFQKLQERLEKQGEESLAAQEIEELKKLNDKSMSLLPKADQKRLGDILLSIPENSSKS